MATKTTDPGLGAADTAKTDAAVTDPMSGLDVTSESTTPGSNRTDPDTDPGPERGDDLLEGLRRDRPPPRLSPRVRAESEGGEAVAYYAGPQSLPARFDTPPLRDAIEIVTTPMSATTEPLPGGPRPIVPVVATNGGAQRRQALAETVPTRRKRNVPILAILVGAAVLFGALLAVWYALRMDHDPPSRPTPGTASVPTTSAVPAPALAAPAAPAVAADTGSAPAVRIEATAGSVRLNGRSPASSGASSVPIRDQSRPPVGPASIPSAEPHPTAPPASSAKVDHVRTI